LRIYKDKPPKDSPANCSRIFDYGGSKDERDDWFKGRVTVIVNPNTSYCYPADKCKD
jgi:hypothetical protein